jgi:hypothetical protein
MAAVDAALETDPRFPSGRWTGFFIQPWIPGRHMMNLDMTFQDGGDDMVRAVALGSEQNPRVHAAAAIIVLGQLFARRVFQTQISVEVVASHIDHVGTACLEHDLINLTMR